MSVVGEEETRSLLIIIIYFTPLCRSSFVLVPRPVAAAAALSLTPLHHSDNAIKAPRVKVHLLMELNHRQQTGQEQMLTYPVMCPHMVAIDNLE